jgi:translocation and assembly module TamB
VLKAASRRRKLVRILVFLILAAIVLLGALPGWWPWILPTLAKRFGATYTQYTRHGYQRFELSGVSFSSDSGRFRADRIEAYVPTTWLWRCAFGPKTEPFLRVSSWSWESISAAGETASTPSAFESFQRTETAAATLRRWLPRAELEGGAIRVKGQALAVPHATWAEGMLSVKAIGPRPELAFSLMAAAKNRGALSVGLEAEELAFRSEVALVASGGGLALEGAAFWMSNRIELKAAFPRAGLLPETASLRAGSFEVPARLIQLHEYGDFRGALHAEWITNRFALDLKVRSLARQDYLPPIDIEARCSGDGSSMQIDLARMSSPWLRAELSGPTRLFYEPPFLPESVALNLTADLDQQPWFAARGQLAGRATLQPSTSRLPQIHFTLAGADVVVSNVAARKLQIEGNLLWPRLELARAAVEMADGSMLSLSGNWDIREQTIDGGRLDFSGPFGQQFLPPGVSFKSASLTAEFSGAPGLLTNSAKLEVGDLSLPAAGPLQLVAEWSGQGLKARQLHLAVSAGDSLLRLWGSADLTGDGKSLDVTALNLGRSNRVELQLQQPFQVGWQAPDASSNLWTFTLQPVICAGPGRCLELEAKVAWPQEGSLRGLAEGLDGAFIQDSLRTRLPVVKLDRLAFTAAWTNGPVLFQVESKAGLQPAGAASFVAEMRLAGGGNGVAIKQFSVSSDTQTVCRAQGTLPVVFTPGNVNGLVQIHRDAPLRLALATEASSVLWDEIAAFSGVRLRQPHLEADLEGTWARPSGGAALRAQRVEFPRFKSPLPALQDVDLVLEMDEETARLSRFHALIEGQPVEITAEIPFATDFWEDPVHPGSWPDWREASAHLRISDAQLAPLAGYLPAILIPEGNARADLMLKPGGVLDGEIRISGAGTRPLGNLGAVRDIQAGAVFSDGVLLLTNISADIGGQRLTAWGRAELDERSWQDRRLPPFELHLQGTNLPLVRRPSLILRADADLAVTNDPTATPLITGTVRLRDGLFLADLKSLAPERSASPSQRPPYFSIESAPWSDWRLQVSVSGEGFMRVQTPLFRGRLSSTLELIQTLKDPLALGEVRIQSGSITFPFGSLDVKHGFASVTSEDPFRPQLDVRAAALRYGHDVKLEVSGPADAPLVQFSSIPPLTSEQILLMLTTGQLPSGVGASSTAGQRAQGLALFVGKNFLTQLGLGTSDKEQLTLRSGEQVSDTGRATYEIEYSLTDNVSLIGSYDRFDQYNLNLKLRVYSR